MRGSYHAEETNVKFIDKNGRGDFIRAARVTSEKGEEYLDLRLFYTNDEGERCPTQKGVRFNIEIAVKVMAALLDTMTPDEFNAVMDLENEENQEGEDNEG